MLAGRDAERASIAAIIDAAHAGSGGALVVRGVAGTGKSALLAEAAAHAGAGMTVLRTQGVESESPLPFAALQRLLWPLRKHIDQLPSPQQAALATAFGQATGEGDRFVAFLGTLSLLADAGEDTPVLVVVDDAHWLDDASAAALLFVARRLQAEQVAILFAVRDGDPHDFAAPDLPTITVGGIDAAAAQPLLAAGGARSVDDAVCAEMVVATAGNPLALGELADILSPDQLAGTAPLPDPLPLTGGVERAFLDRYRRLSEQPQRLLLVAVTDDTARLPVVWDAARRLGIADDALDAAEQAGLLRVDADTVTLFHPLVRSAIYRAATSAQRRAAHQALADALTSDPDRRAWHRAAAADRPDPDVATALAEAAQRAAARGGHEAAAAAWARSAELTDERETRARRRTAAAEAAWLAGQPARARGHADAARPDTDDRVLRADLDKLRARIDWNVASVLVAQRILLHAVADIADIDPRRARSMAMLAAAIANFVVDSTQDMTAEAVRFGDADACNDDQSRRYAHLLSGFVHARLDEYGAAADQFRSAQALGDPGNDTDLRSNLGIAALLLGDDATIHAQNTQLLAEARDNGAVVVIIHALTRRAVSDLATGDWTTLSAGCAEALDLAGGSGQPALALFAHGWLAVLAAFRDETDRVYQHLAAIDSQPAVGVTGSAVATLGHWARALTADNPTAALRHAEQFTGAPARLATLDRIDLAIRADRPDLARQWADQSSDFGDAVDAAWARAAGAYGRALLAPPDAAGPLWQQAVENADASGRRFDRARIHLGYGEYLRRARRRVDARTHLRTALDTFDELGATRWAERATVELRASGETARRRDVTTTVQLTAQERQVATLVKQGLSNKDIAAQLFVSPRTVDFHLRNVFAKAGISSRGALSTIAID